ncbi:uncharacterized protein LOC114747369 [Neltuma alba]|uniref:uncharacterized protein LOC114747369 n=1 Tax=Neltuma alba TaxID=207710 RepID=UPI0010A3AC11|nr:uncharacterized protein LOC114747369 [Prosopis alba]XP_028791521.1 uncharacterized protein LOC114747369 [Prosopis alba]
MSFKEALTRNSRAFTAEGESTSVTTAPQNMTESEEMRSTSSGAPNGSGPDSLSQLIISHRLNGNNYLQWSRNILMFVRGRNKEKYLTWNPQPPKTEDPQYETWCAENNTVMTWLVHSMLPEISENYLLASSAREIWESARRTYSVKENTAAIFQLKRMLRSLTQGEKSVTQYYSALVRLWLQIDLYEVHKWSCHTDEVYFKQVIDRDRCYDFLLGLNDSFEDIRGRIMSIKPLPSLEDAFNMIKNEESRKALVQNPSLVSPSTITEGSAMVTRSNQGGDTRGKKSLRCDHCNKNGHTRDTCWKIHGKPANWKPRPKGEGFSLGQADWQS